MRVVCHESIKEDDELHLILVWFQNPDRDSFAVTVEKVKAID